MRTGEYDGVSASGDATLRLIAGGDVAPVNTDLIPNYTDVFEALKDQPQNTVDGSVRRPARPRREPADVAHRQGQAGAGLLGRRLRRELAVQGQGHGLRQPDLHRRRGAVPEGDPARARASTTCTSSTTSSSRPSVDLLKKQREIIGEYWSDYTKEQAAFTSGDSVVGTTWQVIANLLEADKVPVERCCPKEGATGLVGHVDDLTPRPRTRTACTCGWTTSSPRRPTRPSRSGSARRPSNQKSCAETAVKNHCEIFHADDEEYFSTGRVLDDPAQGLR